MEQNLRDSISRIVREIVVEAYGGLTCAATVKVLSEVLSKGWGIDLSPHIVSLKILTPKVIEILENSELSNEQKLKLIEQLPSGEKPKRLESGDDGMKFHMVGLSGSENEFVLWDPSIDQVNIYFDSCRLEPLSLPMSTSKTDADGNIIFVHQGCQLIYKEQEILEKFVFKSDVWLTDYSHLFTKALELSLGNDSI